MAEERDPIISEINSILEGVERTVRGQSERIDRLAVRIERQGKDQRQDREKDREAQREAMDGIRERIHELDLHVQGATSEKAAEGRSWGEVLKGVKDVGAVREHARQLERRVEEVETKIGFAERSTDEMVRRHDRLRHLIYVLLTTIVLSALAQIIPWP